MDRKRTIEAPGTRGSSSLESRAELERHPFNTRARRARAVAETVIAAGPALDPLLRALGARLARWRRRRQTYDALMRCSDRVLADIGIAREDIPLVAKAIDPGHHAASKTGRGRRWHEMRLRLDGARRAWRERRRIHRELMAYNDHELDDLGIRRSDITAIVRGRLPAPA